jgi:hypothetical protein
MNVHRFLIMVAPSLIGALVPVSAQVYTFDAPSSSYTAANSISTSGAITGYYQDASGVIHGFVRDPLGNITAFDAPSSSKTYAYSINTSGAITGVYVDASGVIHGFVRDPLGNITAFDAPSSSNTWAFTINTRGAITGVYLDTSGVYHNHGFVRDPMGNITAFDPPSSSNTLAESINTSGAITGSYEEASGSHGFVRDPLGNITAFDAPSSSKTYAYSINTSGAITGYYQDASGVYHGFVRDPLGNITAFDAPSSSNTYAGSINTSGAITGYYQDASGVYHGFVRDSLGNITAVDSPCSIVRINNINTSEAITGFCQVGSGFVGTVPNGIDISKYTTPNPIPNSSWQSAVAAGVSYVVVQAWGGVSQNKLANAQLTAAQSYGHGLKTGAYVLLTYFSNKSPKYQLSQAVQAIGSAITALKLLVVDVEICCGEFVNWKASTPYLAGAQIMDPANHIQKVISAGTSGAMPPAWNDTGSTTPDGTATWQDSGLVVVNQTQRIAYVSNAVSYINQQYPNLHVAIYTSNGSDKNWQTITGNCGTTGTNLCPSLISLPLWDVEHKLFTAGDGTKHVGDGVAGLVPWTPWGSTTWQGRSGNQYDWGSCAKAALPLEQNADPEARPAVKCGNNSYFSLNAVDLDYFNPTLFQ